MLPQEKLITCNAFFIKITLEFYKTELTFFDLNHSNVGLH